MNPAQGSFTMGAATPSAPLRFRDRVRARVGSAELLVFRAGNERFAVDLQAVDETIERPEVHKVPEAPSMLLGVFQHQGQLLPLYHAARVLDVPDRDAAFDAALVMRAGARRIGLAVADVEDVVHVELNSLRDCPEGAWSDELLLALILRERHVIGVLDARSLVIACQTPPVPEAL